MAPPVRLPRLLHQGVVAVGTGLATAASRTTNPLLLALVVVVAGYVVMARRTDAPWARSYAAFLKLALVVIALRMVFATLLGTAIEGPTVVLTLPEIPLPAWAAGIRLGGDVTLEDGAHGGVRGDATRHHAGLSRRGQLAGQPAPAARATCRPLYEIGVALVVALTFAPQLVAEVQRVRGPGCVAVRTVACAACVAGHAGPRGGAGALPGPRRRDGLRAATAAPPTTRAGSAGHRGADASAACSGSASGLYGLFDASSPRLLGMPLLALGVVAAALGLALAGRRHRGRGTGRTRGRCRSGSLPAAVSPPRRPWSWPRRRGRPGLRPSTLPLQVPPVPLSPVAAS